MSLPCTARPGADLLRLAVVEQRRPTGAHPSGGAFALAFGLTAFFWIPALAETDYVKINAITASLPDINVTRNLMARATYLRPR
jgi:hypothetical protein